MEQLEADAIESDRALAARLAGTVPFQGSKRSGYASIYMEPKSTSTRGSSQSTMFVAVGNSSGIQGLDLTLNYDASKVSIVDVRAVDPQSGYNAIWNATNGTLQVAFYGFAPLKSGTRLLAITVRPHSPTKVVMPRIVRAVANEGNIPIRIVGITATTPPVVVGDTTLNKSSAVVGGAPQKKTPKRK